MRYPMREAFDRPDKHASCGRRGQRTPASQPLKWLEWLDKPRILNGGREFAARMTNASNERAERPTLTEREVAKELVA